MRLGDTIAAVSSPPGRSPRGIVRLSGPTCRAIARDRLGIENYSRGTLRARFGLEPAPVACLALLAPAPGSYTGEDTLEIVMPGSPTLLQRVINIIIMYYNVRRAEPGEFTARACLNGRISLDRADGVSMMIAAENRAQIEAARRTLAGEFGAECDAAADDLAAILALVEAGIDFSDQEDVTVIDPATLSARLAAVAAKVRTLCGDSPAKVRDRAPTVALVGPANAGKSTLFNALVGRTRAVASHVAGTTRDVIAEPIDLSQWNAGPLSATLVDLAGIGAENHVGVDQLAQRSAEATIRDADVIVLCDPVGRFGDLSLSEGRPVVRVRTKADLVRDASAADNPAVIAVCALDGRNITEVRAAIARAVAVGGESGALVAPRHAAALARAGAALGDAQRAALTAGCPMELVADAMRRALDALGEITGAVTTDDLLGRVFASFCIGK